MRRVVLVSLLVMVGLSVCPDGVLAAETDEPTQMVTTRLLMQLGGEDSVDVGTSFRASPPTITVTFPRGRVIGSLPERSRLAGGVIESIATHYDGVERGTARYIRAIDIVLTGPYAYTVQVSAGQIILAITHPAVVPGEAMTIGLGGGMIVRGMSTAPVSERFRAMQTALASASSLTRLTRGVSSRVAVQVQPAIPEVSIAPVPGPVRVTTSTLPESAAPPSIWFWALVTFAAGMTLLGVWWFMAHGPLVAMKASNAPAGSRPPSAVVLIDELVWRSFQRQGYQLIRSQEILQPPGTLRTMMKNGTKTALLCVGNGGFFEKQTVEQFLAAKRQTNAEQGFLVASGSFTVPAQRLAKARGITLLGREQLMELLGTAASSEYVARQLDAAHARLEEARETLRQYARQLDLLRRQRNEASWYLGEERAKTGQLEAQLLELGLQVRRQQTELERAEQEANALRKQMEEHQWYRGEAEGRIQHLKVQLSEAQNIIKRVETVEQERDQVNWVLAEERRKVQDLGSRLAKLQRAIDESVQREIMLQEAFDRMRRTLSAFQTYGERRRAERLTVSGEVVVQVSGRAGTMQSVTGTVRDVSSTGVGLSTEQTIPAKRFRVRFSFPGLKAPIETAAQLMWQQANGEPARYQSGVRLTGLSRTDRASLKKVLAKIPA